MAFLRPSQADDGGTRSGLYQPGNLGKLAGPSIAYEKISEAINSVGRKDHKSPQH